MNPEALKFDAEQLSDWLLEFKQVERCPALLYLGEERAQDNSNRAHLLRHPSGQPLVDEGSEAAQTECLSAAMAQLDDLSHYRNRYARRMSEAEQKLFACYVADALYARIKKSVKTFFTTGKVER